MDALPLPDGADALAETAGVRRLDDQAVLRVSGDDARAWLDGQITNEVATASPGRATYALVVSLKGRVLSDLWVLDRGEHLDLVLPSDRRSPIAEYLDQFIVMEDVEFELPDAVVVTVQGPAAPRVAERVDGQAQWWACTRLGTEGRERLVPEAEAGALIERLEEAARAEGGGLVDGASWELARLRAGVPRMGADFGQATLPQEAGLKDRAVSFQKGCYQGQEAVVMLEHRGKPPKKLARLTIEAEVPPEQGTPITREDGRAVGEVTSAMADPREPGRCPALGLLKRDFATEGAELSAGTAPIVVRTVLGG